ncbi:ATP-binding protein [Streptomyces sp. CRN 30]|uniref:ATP-binding protein n=1 Tax=Streptomyces sp. CRN 30 TaxID=3075613 RepID=UPI002A809048|nr:ATP-binding protein [Streptomyces sp. CRN 30]
MLVKWCRAFPGLPEQVAEARHFVAAVLHGWRGAEAAVLVVSELAANAVQHTLSGADGGRFLVIVDFRAESVRLEVVDQGGDRLPQRCDATSQQEGGRGLTLVAAFSKDWGVADSVDGRSVWADFSLGGA